jgi:hypothetical protein
MTPARQVLRWTIPGWLFFLLLFVFDGIRVAFGASSPLWQIIKTNASLLLAISAAGLPTGFLIYQIYFWVYWSFPFPTVFGLGQPLDRARDILKDVLDIDFDRLAARDWDETPESATTWKAFGLVKIGVKDPEIMTRYRDNWLLANFVWHKTVVDNGLEPLETTAQGYSDVYHSLGTARWSLVFASGLHICTAIANIWPQRSQLYLWAPLVVNLSLVYVLFRALTAARYDTLSTLLQFKHDFITYYHRIPQKKGDGKGE